MVIYFFFSLSLIFMSSRRCEQCAKCSFLKRSQSSTKSIGARDSTTTKGRCYSHSFIERNCRTRWHNGIGWYCLIDHTLPTTRRVYKSVSRQAAGCLIFPQFFFVMIINLYNIQKCMFYIMEFLFSSQKILYIENRLIFRYKGRRFFFVFNFSRVFHHLVLKKNNGLSLFYSEIY